MIDVPTRIIVIIWNRFTGSVAAEPFRNIILDGETWMKDREDLKLKAELDEIMKGVDIIMKKVETAIPAKKDEAQPENE